MDPGSCILRIHSPVVKGEGKDTLPERRHWALRFGSFWREPHPGREGCHSLYSRVLIDTDQEFHRVKIPEVGDVDQWLNRIDTPLIPNISMDRTDSSMHAVLCCVALCPASADPDVHCRPDCFCQTVAPLP